MSLYEIALWYLFLFGGRSRLFVEGQIPRLWKFNEHFGLFVDFAKFQYFFSDESRNESRTRDYPRDFVHLKNHTSRIKMCPNCFFFFFFCIRECVQRLIAIAESSLPDVKLIGPSYKNIADRPRVPFSSNDFCRRYRINLALSSHFDVNRAYLF